MENVFQELEIPSDNVESGEVNENSFGSISICRHGTFTFESYLNGKMMATKKFYDMFNSYQIKLN